MLPAAQMFEKQIAFGLQRAEIGSSSFPVGAQSRLDENIELRAVAAQGHVPVGQRNKKPTLN